MKDKPVKLEENYEFFINSYSHQGEGVGRIDNFAIFVPKIILGERVRVRITDVKKNFARGKLIQVISSSPDRINPPCPVYHLCGGCQLQHIAYEKQLEMKKEIVENALNRIGNQNIKTLPIIGMKDPWRYRNKGYFHLARENGKIRLGFYKSKSHALVPACQCCLFSEAINRLIKYLGEQLTQQDMSIYDCKTDQGNLRGIILKESKNTGEIMVIFITKEEKLKIDETFLDNLIKTFSQTVSVYQNINKSSKILPLGKGFKLLRGKTSIEDTIGSFKFKISPASFFQVNVSQAQVLYEKILEYANLCGEETVIDSYCGTGTISIYLAGKAKRVYGLELEKGAVRDSRENCKLNNLSNLKFFTGEAEKWLCRWIKNREEVQIMVIDPPRTGCSREMLRDIIKTKPEKILYVSCNLPTLARDIKYLAQSGYKLEKVQPVDMFPQTRHIECITYLRRC
ncbi:MAG TPA: 23S rRNA (uracil(1939)-C(5))-methyltransferase RlmD [Candidatus Atribacteria bacterium]|nr:23S rRNA (uracil(1939)-C(5))-methyltransferase RlmD [Candidatus Atribacteria bacterium]